MKKSKSESKKAPGNFQVKKGHRKFIVKNGLRFLVEKGCLVFDGVVKNTIDHGFHSYSRFNALKRA